MNKFEVVKCIDMKESDYDGPCIILGCVSNPEVLLFFPINKDNSKMINYVLDKNSEYDINTNILGIYRTMIESWSAADRFLSGIIMDAVWDDEVEEDILSIRLAISDHNGEIDGMVHVNFLHAMLLSAMEDVGIIISDKLLSKMIPEDDEDDDDDNKTKKKKPPSFPEDKKIVDIAKKIMSGKTKDQ